MMRAALIVIGFGTLVVMELGTPPRTKTSAPDPFDQLTIDASVLRDTLQTADRLETHYQQHDATVPPIPPVEATSPPEVTAIVPKEDLSTVGRGTNDKNDLVRKPKPTPKYTAPNKPRPKPTNSNKAAQADRPKAMVEVKPCRPNAFDSLLQALNLSSRCQT